MNITLDYPLTSSGYELDLSPACFGELESSHDLWLDANFIALRERMNSQGYLYLSGLLNEGDIREARRTVTERLLAEGVLDARYPAMEAVAASGVEMKFRPDVTKNNAPLERALYQGSMIEFFEGFLDSPVRHFDFTWFRAIAPGKGTPPHCDTVYMGRGTSRLYTAWVPVGDIPLEVGGLMVLEKSHLQSDKLQNYLSRDVDAYCTNRAGAAEIESGKKSWSWDGSLSKNPVSLREKLGGRWLTARQFRMGDVLIFSIHTVHASLDNQSRSFRFSSDSRYQRADEPADERWIGNTPIGHSLAGKRGRIC